MWAVRATGDAARLAGPIRTEVAAIDPLLPIANMRPFIDYVDDAMAETRFALTLIGVFATIALVLAAIGLYGVLAWTVRQRTAEIGVRMAFGARKATILQLVVRQGLGLSAIGIAIGVGGALALTRVMENLLVGVTPTDPITFAAITCLFVIVTLLASAIPALRASRVDPGTALRQG
jgi:putative ABC transport system permease protein